MSFHVEGIRFPAFGSILLRCTGSAASTRMQAARPAASFSLSRLSSTSGVAGLAFLEGEIIFDCALYAGGEFLPAFWRIQSALARQDIPGEFAAFFLVVWGHSMLRWT